MKKLSSQWQAFDQQQQEASIEQDNRAPSTLDPSLLGTSGFNPANYITRLPQVQQFQELPSWGWQSAARDISTAGPQIAQDIINAPVAAATRATALQEQTMNRKRPANRIYQN